VSAAAPAVVSCPLAADTDLLALHRFAPERYPMLLESAAAGAGARWDVLLLTEGEGFVLDRRGQLTSLAGAALAGGFLDRLDAESAGSNDRASAVHWPFRGGWAVYLGYELAGDIESSLSLPEASGPLPRALALRSPAAVLRDRLSGEVVALAEIGRDDLLATMRADVAALGSAGLEEPGNLPLLDWREDPPERFLAGVARVADYLRAGDVFQVNLSRGWSARFDGPPDACALYRQLRKANPAPFAGLLHWRDAYLLSSSPERLIAIRGGEVETRPIAGTFARLPGEDSAVRIAELVANPKERAEHIMLIDLERNDLGRVCTPGSVRVDELMTVESYAHVHHIVSSVRGRLREGVGPGAAIAAVFPGGTITGCPKVRCMQIIAELEGEGRGPYTGAIGYLNRDGDLDLNILIRTAWLDRAGLYWRTGAGLVADSVPERELAETRAKARGLLRAWGLPE
jgi:anthranilate synthase component 1